MLIFNRKNIKIILTISAYIICVAIAITILYYGVSFQRTDTSRNKPAYIPDQVFEIAKNLSPECQAQKIVESSSP